VSGLTATASLVSGAISLYCIWNINTHGWRHVVLWMCWVLASISFATGLVGIAWAIADVPYPLT
jgi:hypothetical protein